METQVRTYSLSIEQHNDGYLAYFPALPGCQTWGRSYAEAISRAEEALPLYLETLASNGDLVPENDLIDDVTLGITVRTHIVT